MSNQIVEISPEYWNIRGEFKIGGLVNIGTHASLIKRTNGKYLFLDAYTLSDEIKHRVDRITDEGKAVEAIINLHPFHTVHVKKAHQQYPHAKLYGTKRHLEKFPDLPWQPELSESQACAALFADDLEFSVPAGVDFISSNEHLHFSSVLAYHKASKTIHSDDTLMYLPLPGLLGKLKKPDISFHMTLSQTLEKRAGAAEDFRNWVKQLAEQWGDAENLCAAHSATLLGSENQECSIADRIISALEKVERKLKVHERKYG